MPKLIDINAISLKELVDARPDLVSAIKAGEDEIRMATSVEKDIEGRITRWVEEQLDLDGMLLGRRVDEYSYYDSGEINTIVQLVYDGEGGLVSRKQVNHFKGSGIQITKVK